MSVANYCETPWDRGSKLLSLEVCWWSLVAVASIVVTSNST